MQREYMVLSLCLWGPSKLRDLPRTFTAACLRCGSTNGRVKKMEGDGG